MEYVAKNNKEQRSGIIDPIDCDLVDNGVNLDSDGYARIGSVRLHRVITSRVIGGSIPKGKVVDHINRNRLDNRRCNLRLCTPQENAINTRKFRGTSNYIGVSWSNRLGKWYAQIKHNGKVKYLGIYEDEIEAAKTYNKAAIELHGKFATLNKIERNNRKDGQMQGWRNGRR